MMYKLNLYKLAAVVFWALAVLLFVLGLNDDAVPPDGALDEYALGVGAALTAMTFTGMVVIELTVARVMSVEMATSRSFLATAVAKALADEIEERGINTCDHDDPHEDFDDEYGTGRHAKVTSIRR